MAEGSPTVRRRELGTLLRRLREENGMSVKQVTEHLMCSPSKVSRVETGQRGATLRDIRDLCDLYGVTDQAERDHLMTLAKEGKQQAWWQAYDLPYATYVGLEVEALSIRCYDSAVVPGLLQTSGYARAVHEAVVPKLSPEVIEQRVEERIKRQRQLAPDGPPSLHFILDEAVLHRVVGSPQVMKAQAMRIREDMDNQNMTVQIIPYRAGAHPALDSVFTILELPRAISNIVYVEGLVGQVYLERPQDSERYSWVFDRLTEMALNVDESKAFVSDIANSYGINTVSLNTVRTKVRPKFRSR